MKTGSTSHKKYVLIAIMTAFISFNGCKTDTTYILTEEELKWLVYNNDQQIKFQNDSGKIRTYAVYGRWRGDGNASAAFKLIGDTVLVSPSSLLLYKDGSGFVVTVSWPHHPIKFTPTSMVAMPDTVAGTSYNDVYISVASSTDSIYNVKEVHYSKTTGVIKFIENTGEVWKLKN